MRKRLALMFCLLMVSLLGFVGCASDPYASMTLTTKGLQETNVQQLLIEQTIEGGSTTYVYPSIDFTVSVNGIKDYPDILVSGWEGYIEEPVLEYQGNGVTRIISKPLSHNSTGKFTLNVSTSEGNKNLNIDFNIELKLNDFYLKKGVLNAVAQENVVVLDDLGGFVEYSPTNTTQKDIEYSIAVPRLGSTSGQYYIADRLDENVSYIFDEMYEEYSEYKYADVIVDSVTGKQSLKVYAYLMDSSNKVVKDSEGNPIPAMYPQILQETTSFGQAVYADFVTLRAHSVTGQVADRFIDIEVVPGVGEVLLQMNSQSQEGEEGVFINTNSKGEYDIVLVDNDYAGGVLTSDELDYYTMRTLNFYVKGIVYKGDEAGFLDEYIVTIEEDYVLPNDGKPIDLSPTEVSTFKVSSLSAGDYTHTFIVEHKDYPELFRKEIKVNFHVISIPSKITINNQTISAVGDSGINVTVYNTYPRGSYGTKFKVNTNSNFSYFVYIDQENVAAFGEKITLRKDGDGSTGVLAYYNIEGETVGHISPIGDSLTYSNFGKTDSFYLSHNLDSIPDEPLRMYVGIMFSMAHNSYSEEIKQEYFDYTLLSFPMNISFENGVDKITFAQSSYNLNLDNTSYAYSEDEYGEVVNPLSGIKLWDLPVGQTVAKCVKNITYDKDLIKVYEYYEPETDISSLYIKYVDIYNVGNTTIQVETYNGLSKSVSVSTYIPTIYKNNEEPDENGKYAMPLAIKVDQYSTGYLYHVTGASILDHKESYDLMAIRDEELVKVDSYDSVESLFMIVNAKQYIDFYDYRALYNEESGEWEVSEINITNKVKVTSSHPNYATYSNGVITSYANVTRNRQPVTLTVTYTAGYESFDENGLPVYTTYKMTHKIYLYIYVPLEGVEVTSSKAVDLYVDQSLGYFSKDLASHTIESTFLPNKPELGAEWNEASDSEWGLFPDDDESIELDGWDPVELRFEHTADIEGINNVILDNNGEPIKLKASAYGRADYIVRYSDIFSVKERVQDCECDVVCRISSELWKWLNDNYYSTDSDKEAVLMSKIFNNNIEFVINIYINQFNKLQNINSVKITAKYASRINNLKLDVEEDGVYFELREKNGKIVVDKDKIEIGYTIDNSSAINKDILLAVYNSKGEVVGYSEAYDESSLPYTIKVEPSSTGNSGVIVISPNKRGSTDVYRDELQLIVVPEDNISEKKENGTYVFYNNVDRLVKSFRIKVADGSEDHPFEIRNVNDYLRMIEDINDGNCYYYIITRTLDFNGYDIGNVSFTNCKNPVNITGKHEYVKNGQKIVTYNALYNVEIKRTITASGEVNIGLFGFVNEVAKLDNIYIRNANIEIIDESENATINVGLLAGMINGTSITNSSIAGKIKIIRNKSTSIINVGGVVGCTISQANIDGMPGNYENGIVASGNSVDVDIELSGNESVATNTIVGGVVGTSNNTTISNLQVVSMITTKIEAVIGGVVGSLGSNAVIDSLNVSPKIISNITTVSNSDENIGLVVGGIAGTTSGATSEKYTLTNTVISFVDIGDDENYSWQQRANIFVFAPSSKVTVGGLIGLENSEASGFKYNYVRSYYEVDLSDTYRGNIYVIASSGAVGGLIGKNYASSGMTFSYFDGDIVASSGLNTGLIIGELQLDYNITNSYAIGYLYNIEIINDNSEIYYEYSPVEFIATEGECDVSDGIWTIAEGQYTKDTTKELGSSNYNPYTYSNDSLKNATNTYAVVNGSINYFAERGIVYVVAGNDTDGNSLSLVSLVGDEVNIFLKNEFDYSIATTTTINGEEWLWHKNLNTVVVGGNAIAYPIILKEDGKALFDLIPSAITVAINDTRDDLYDISINNGANVQVMMFMQRNSYGVNQSNYYEMSINKETAEFSITVSGASVYSEFIDKGILKANDQLEFLENTNERVIRIEGNRIYPVSSGVAILTIRSYVAKSVKLQVTILVVDGITDYKLVTGTQEIENYEDNINDKPYVFYIDELANYRINALNTNGYDEYIANDHFGFIFEILDARTEDEDGNKIGKNGVIKIGDILYSYNEASVYDNIYTFNAKDFDVKGVTHGLFKFAITPFVLLDDVVYEDTYTSISDSTITKEISEFNAYILDDMKIVQSGDETITSIPMQKIYNFEILARAIGIENSKSEVAIDASNIVSFKTILETANVSVELGEDGYAYVTILENILVRINDKKYNSYLDLKNKTFKCTISTDSNGKEIYTCEKLEFETYEFDYTLINIEFNNITITYTNIDSLSRLNTYKVSIGGRVSFDRNYYRAHANAYDLNTVNFDVKFIPETNENKVATLNVNIVPREITSIFTNFYSRGEDALNNGGTNIEYPEENDTSFIVPGREGLLKITLDEEFNNSSYITISLDMKYFGYVTFTQMSAVVNDLTDDINVGEVSGYSEVAVYNQFQNNDSFGIRLSKQSINYNAEHYFNNTYYVKILVDKNISESNLAMNIISYKIDGTNTHTKQLETNCNLTIMELPEIRMTLDGEEYSVLGKGVKKPLEIFYKGLTQDISYTINSTSNNALVNDYVYIVDEVGENANGILSLDYLNSGKKYYVCQDVETEAGSKFTINFNAMETILGIVETTNCDLKFDTVGFEIESIKVCGQDDIISINHGQTIRLDTQIKYKDIVIGSSDKISEYKNQIDGALGVVSIAEYGFAGAQITTFDGNGNSIKLTNGSLGLYYRVIKDTQITYEKMSHGLYGGITLSQEEKKGTNISELYYELHGTTISDDTYIRLDVDYYYSEDGSLIVSNDSINSYNFTIDLLVVVEDNSTYDHPVPIEDENDFRAALTIEKGNFILLNNIELNNWAPIDATFATLDGNGYTIKINSFNLSSSRGGSSANVGIFSTLSVDSLVKNLTIDISPLLKSETAVINDIAYMRASTKDSYVYRANIDLGYTTSLNFGVLAGVNNGAITNTKVISTSSGENKYLHIVTTLGNVNGSLVESNIGGLVGTNSETGAITNSYVGVNISDSSDNNYYLTGIPKADKTRLNNSDDELEKIQIYPFILAGGNNIGGIACINDGYISNSYNKGMGIYNPFPTVGNSATAGLVTYNNNVITSSFVEGDSIGSDNKANKDYRIESTGYIGGLVYENNAKIENSYTNVYIQTLSSFLGGFVFINNADGTISNSYSTTINKSSLAIGQFTGIIEDKVQNFGTYNNCYYTVNSDNGEFSNINESAIALDAHSNPYDQTSSWKGFSFSQGNNGGGIWEINSGMPKIITTLTDTISFRKLVSVESSEESGYIYNYSYDTYYLGTLQNPLIIDKAENFDHYIIDNSFKMDEDSGDTRRVFGLGDSDSIVKYVRIVNNLDFEQIPTAKMYKDTYLYKVVFAGVLDGNGLNLNNLNITTETEALDNFGLFAQIGHENATSPAVIKNLSLSVRTYRSISNTNAGILAGTIVNSSIINVDINGNDQTITGVNTSGALAGLIYATNDLSISLVDIEIQNIRVASSYGSLGEVISSRSQDTSTYFFESFSAYKDGQVSGSYSFNSLYTKKNVDGKEINYTDLTNKDKIKTVSYSGGVAGVILANNYNVSVDATNTYENYRTKTDASTINNIVVKGNVTISTADNAGGLFGYIGENTLIRNSKFVLSGSQLLKAFNNIGGIVGENHGVIEQCTVAYDETTQETYDATILTNTRDNGTYNLFHMTEGESYYVVSIGGIAGLSEDGVIIDSYAKVNVVNPLSFIAGGIIGYSKGYNYLGYVYNTGTVYSRRIIGGIIGLQVNNYKESNVTNLESNVTNLVYMDNVVSLSNWNASSDTINYRNEITTRLYNNTSIMYKKDTSYYNYYIKMPEVGNAPIKHMDYYEQSNSDGTKEIITINQNEILTAYRSNHSENYIGSVVGKSLIRDGGDIVNGSTSSNDDFAVYANKDTLKKVYSDTNVKNVFSATLGIITTTGNVESGTRVDDYFKSSFTINNGSDSTITSLSYRIAYNESSESLNAYNLSYEAEGNNAYVDRFTYDKVFTSQEYIQQLLGESYVPDQEEEEAYACKTTRNIFTNGFADNRYISSNTSDGAFVVASATGAKVWDVEDYLPKFSTSVFSAVEEVSTSESLKNAFMYGISGQVFKVTGDIVLNINDTDRSIKFAGGVKASFVGAKNDGSNPTIPTITINVKDSDKSTTIASVFNLMSGAMIQDINFVIKTKTNFNALAIDYEDYGLLANTLDGVYINNCTFTINVTNDLIVESNSGSTTWFNAKNVGVLFGSVLNSNIIDSTFYINAPKVSISALGTENNGIVKNFGLFAGNIKSSNISKCDFGIVDTEITVSNGDPTSINIGGLAGSIVSSKVMTTDMYRVVYDDDNITEPTDNDSILNITINDYLSTDKNIGALFGYAKQLNMSGTKDDFDKVKTNSFNLTYNANKGIKAVNASLVVGCSEASKISNFIVGGKLTMSTMSDRNSITTLNVGSVIGYDKASSQLGKAGVTGSIATIESTINTMNLAVGGLVGFTDASYDMFNNSYFDGEINVTNKQVCVTEDPSSTNEDGSTTETSVTTSANTFVGGILGYAKGRVGLTNSIGAGIINVVLTDSEPANGKPILVGIGGIIGGTGSTSELENFVSLAEISIEQDYTSTYVSGVIGYNNGLFIGTNGYSYVQLPQLSQCTTSSITNGTLSAISENVFYAQEFIGNNYYSDTCFHAFALGDLYGTISDYSSICKLNDIDGLTKATIGNIQLYVPSAFVILDETGKPEDCYISRDAGEGVEKGSNKFVLSNVKDDRIDSDERLFNVITETSVITEEVDLNDFTKQLLKFNQIISGRSTIKGKVVVSFESGAFIDENHGIISNIYLIAGKGSDKNISLTTTNEDEGLITNCYVYGLSNSQYALAETNNGRIYSSATAVKFVQSDGVSELYGLVDTNAESGVIRDCYSGSFGYTENHDMNTDLYGFARANWGIIEYSTYYIPEGMEYDNNNKDFFKKSEDAGLTHDEETKTKNAVNCYKDKLPSNLLKRDTIWKDENGHVQIVGFKDIDGSINIRIYITIDKGAENEISGVADLKARIQTAIKQNKPYTLSYKFGFYEKENPTYNVVRICKGEDFAEYVQTLKSGIIGNKSNTIVLFTNDMSKSDNTHVIEVDASTLRKFSINDDAAIIGINTADSDSNETPNITLNFATKAKDNSDVNGEMYHEFISENNGLIANINLTNVSFIKTDAQTNYFAPILKNNGLIYNFNMTDIAVKATISNFVAGMLYSNESNGEIYDCIIYNLSMSSLQFVNRICTTNLGVYNNVIAKGTINYVGTLRNVTSAVN